MKKSTFTSPYSTNKALLHYYALQSQLAATCFDLTAIIRVKVKLKYTILQALSLCTGRTAHRGSGGIALLLGKGKVHPCTGTEALYRLYGP